MIKTKILKFSLAITLIIVILSGCSSSTFSSDKVAKQTKDILVSFATSQYSSIYQQFDSLITKSLTVDQFAATCAQTIEMYQMQLGEYQISDESVVDQTYSVTVTYSDCIFPIELHMTIDKDYKISSFYLKPSLSVTPSKYSQIEISFNDLSGYLMKPNNLNAYDVVIMVAGSGPNDRDETIGPNKPFLQLAENFASAGIATFRFDKRSLVKPQSLPKDLTVDDEFVNDVVDIFTTLKNDTAIKRIFILGHSLGAMLMPRIASLVNADGYILLAAPAIKLQTLIYQQYQYLLPIQLSDPAQVKQILETTLLQVENIDKLTVDSDIPTSLMFNINKEYWLDLNDYDQVESSKFINQPTFFGFGENDYQVPPDNMAKFKQVLTDDNFIFKLYPMNHILSTNGKGPDSYMEKSDIFPTLLLDLVQFIKES